jgi:hypothetical protein
MKHIANAVMFIPELHKEGNKTFYRIKGGEKLISIQTNTTL